jgi:hypothetical protein
MPTSAHKQFAHSAFIIRITEGQTLIGCTRAHRGCHTQSHTICCRGCADQRRARVSTCTLGRVSTVNGVGICRTFTIKPLGFVAIMSTGDPTTIDGGCDGHERTQQCENEHKRRPREQADDDGAHERSNNRDERKRWP